MRKHPNTNDLDIAKLKPFAEEISKIKEADFTNAIDKDRLKWLQYWTLKAVELYGENAGVQFS